MRSGLSLLKHDFSRKKMMDFEQAKKVLQLTEGRIKKFGAIDTSTSDEIQRAIFRLQPFQRLVIAHHAQEALTRLKEQIVPLENSLERLIATAIKLNHAEFREFADPSVDKPT
jgi:ABC-type nitrate/sulfonate/bicarbonate transport system ATPase subunit